MFLAAINKLPTWSYNDYFISGIRSCCAKFSVFGGCRYAKYFIDLNKLKILFLAGKVSYPIILIRKKLGNDNFRESRKNIFKLMQI